MMCFKKKIPTAITSTHVYVGMGLNDYMGSANDLRGCVNDINNEVKKLNRDFPEFQCLKYFDSQVTTQFFMSEMRRILSEVSALATKEGKQGFVYLKYSGHGTQIPSSTEPNGYNEALYLYNGPLIDDNIYLLQQETPDNVTVLAKFDSCFSGDIGSKCPEYRKSRFMAMQGVPKMRHAVNHIAKTDRGQTWIIMSGCGEEETSADAYIEGQYQGAFTWANMKSYGRGVLYSQEISDTMGRLFLNHFKQNPEISGPYHEKTFVN